MKKKVNVICFGNILQGDDGFGLHVYNRLRDLNCLGSHVRIIDAGTAGMAALGYFEDCDKAIVVDAINSGASVGTLQRLEFEDFVTPLEEEFSAHNLGVSHLIAFLPILFEGKPIPNVVMIGAETDKIKMFSDQLSPPVCAAIDGAIEMVKFECTNCFDKKS